MHNTEYGTSTRPERTRQVSDHRNLPFREARCKFFNAEKGYGFLYVRQDDDTEKECFVHISTLSRAGYTTLEPDQKLQVKHEKQEKGDTVVLVKYAEGFTPPPPRSNQ